MVNSPFNNTGYIVAVRFSGGGTRGPWRKPTTCRMSMAKCNT